MNKQKIKERSGGRSMQVRATTEITAGLFRNATQIFCAESGSRIYLNGWLDDKGFQKQEMFSLLFDGCFNT
jgi:hypothetical protein